jgi:hypothetical protein
MRKTARWKLELGHVEAFVFFTAMLLAIVVEGACVHWLGMPSARPGEPPTLSYRGPRARCHNAGYLEQ